MTLILGTIIPLSLLLLLDAAEVDSTCALPSIAESGGINNPLASSVIPFLDPIKWASSFVRVVSSTMVWMANLSNFNMPMDCRTTDTSLTVD